MPVLARRPEPRSEPGAGEQAVDGFDPWPLVEIENDVEFRTANCSDRLARARQPDLPNRYPVDQACDRCIARTREQDHLCVRERGGEVDEDRRQEHRVPDRGRVEDADPPRVRRDASLPSQQPSDGDHRDSGVAVEEAKTPVASLPRARGLIPHVRRRPAQDRV
jgi:hypothetical protein